MLPHEVIDDLRSLLTTSVALRWAAAVVLVVLGIVIGSWVRRIIRCTPAANGGLESAVSILARVAQSVIVVVAVITAINLVGIDLGPLLASAGVAGIIIGFAMKDIAENYIAGLVLGFRRAFVIGDEIEVATTFRGRVEELSLRYARLRTRDGLRVYLPNSMLLQEPLINITVNGSRRAEFRIGIGYGEDLDRVRNIAIEAARGVDGVLAERPPQAWIEEFGTSFATLLVRFWYHPDESNKGMHSAVMIAVRRALETSDIALPGDNLDVRLINPQEIP